MGFVEMNLQRNRPFPNEIARFFVHTFHFLETEREREIADYYTLISISRQAFSSELNSETLNAAIHDKARRVQATRTGGRRKRDSPDRRRRGASTWRFAAVDTGILLGGIRI